MRFMRRCSALKTCPMPPAPMAARMVYSPKTSFFALPCTALAAWYFVSLPAETSFLASAVASPPPSPALVGLESIPGRPASTGRKPRHRGQIAQRRVSKGAFSLLQDDPLARS